MKARHFPVTLFALFLVIATFGSIAVYKFLFPPPPPISFEEAEILGKPLNSHQDFIGKLKKDLGLGIEINIYIGPYYHIFGDAINYIEFRPHFRSNVFIDEEFFATLSYPEQKALIAHELGHLIEKWNMERTPENLMMCQIMADEFAAKHAGADNVIGMLRKAGNPWTSKEIRIRIRNMERIKKLKQAE